VLCLLSSGVVTRWRYATACGLAVIASFSFGIGLLVWLVGVWVLYMRNRPVLPWCMAATITASIFIFLLQNPLADADGFSIANMLAFFLVWLGASVGFFNVSLSMVAGASGLVVFLALFLRSGKIKEVHLLPLGLILFSL